MALRLTERDDATIYGPFGGPATKGARAVQLVQSYASGDLLVLVLLEERSGEVGGAPDQPWSLRIAFVYPRESRKWRVVRRHADPLVKRRTLPQTAAIARET